MAQICQLYFALPKRLLFARNAWIHVQLERKDDSHLSDRQKLHLLLRGKSCCRVHFERLTAELRQIYRYYNRPHVWCHVFWSMLPGVRQWNVQHDRPLFEFLKLFGEVHRCVFFGMSLTNIGILCSGPPGDT